MKGLLFRQPFQACATFCTEEKSNKATMPRLGLIRKQQQTLVLPASPSDESVSSNESTQQRVRSTKGHRRSSLDSSSRHHAVQTNSTVAKKKSTKGRRFSLESALRPTGAMSLGLALTTRQSLIPSWQKPSCSSSSSAKRRRVQFESTAKHQRYDPWHHLTPEERQALWYSSNDIALFKRKMSEKVRDIMNAELYNGYTYQSWSSCLIRAYRGFEATDGRDSVACLVACSQTVSPASTIGLEKWIVRGICQDRSNRQHDIFVHIQALQQQQRGRANEAATAKIRAISRAESRSSRLFGHYTAVLAAHEYRRLG